MEPVQLNKRYICIIGHARSGSTVIQRILSAMPETSFRGENEGAIVDICNLLYKINTCQKYGVSNFRQDPADEKSQYYGLHLINIDDLRQSLADIFINKILNANSNSKYIGWKECWFDPLYYGKRNIKKYFEELNILFPNISVIFTLRDPVLSSKSPGLSTIANALDMIKEYHECYNYIHGINLFNNSILLNHEKWNKNPTYLFNELNKLDLPITYESVERILSEELTHLRFLHE